jgi:hypothetical protein
MAAIQVGYASSDQIKRGGGIIENAKRYEVDGLGYPCPIHLKQSSFLLPFPDFVERLTLVLNCLPSPNYPFPVSELNPTLRLILEPRGIQVIDVSLLF